MPACGVGAELALLLPPLIRLYEYRRRAWRDFSRLSEAGGSDGGADRGLSAIVERRATR